MWTMHRLTLAAAMLLGIWLAPIAGSAQSVAEADLAALAGPWQGDWIGAGFRYEARVTLNATADGSVEGAIVFTLRVAPRLPESEKIGAVGTEFVRGRYLPDVRLVILEGYNKDDPDNVLGLDQYRLLLAENGQTLGGITWDHGAWDGQFFLKRE